MTIFNFIIRFLFAGALAVFAAFGLGFLFTHTDNTLYIVGGIIFAMLGLARILGRI